MKETLIRCKPESYSSLIHTVFIVVPGPRKADAVYKMLKGPIEPSCPASVVRTHEDAVLYLDEYSAAYIRDLSLPGQ